MKPKINSRPFKILIIAIGILLILALLFINYEYPKTDWDVWARRILISILFLAILSLVFLKKYAEKLALIYFPFIFLMSLEIISRPLIKSALTDKQLVELGKLRAWTFPEYQYYTAHPFTQYRGNQKYPEPDYLNAQGFVGNDFVMQKTSGTYRILAIGGSTTERGYPAKLEAYLNQKSKNYEVYNMGVSGWTTAHSLNNFMLNGLAYKPDLIIIHHAWNDVLVRNVSPVDFQQDYSHVYKSFEKPTVFDRYLIRSSLLYRYLKWRWAGSPSWTALDLAILSNEVKYQANKNFDDLSELIPFERNIRSMIQVAQSNNIQVVLTSQPCASDSTKALFESAKHIDQCNRILRKLSTQFAEVIFLDLANETEFKENDLFLDLGHMTEEGKQLKAKKIGSAILNQANN